MSSWHSAYLIKHWDNFIFHPLLRLSKCKIEVLERKVNVFVVNLKSLLFHHLPEETYIRSIEFSIEHVCLANSTLDFYMGSAQVDGSYAEGFLVFLSTSW
jgi:hypothetical protein